MQGDGGERVNNIIEQLKNYKRICARIQVLSTYSVGMGITISRLNEDDQLQELHRKLRGLPSYMYLNKHEQELEMTAHAYLTRYPAGTRAQLAAIPKTGANEEDEKKLKEIRKKIRKVIEARGWNWPDDVFDKVIERVTELQDLLEQKKRIDTAMTALESYKPEYAKLLRRVYIDDMPVEDVAEEMGIGERTFWRWKTKAEKEFTKLAG